MPIFWCNTDMIFLRFLYRDGQTGPNTHKRLHCRLQALTRFELEVRSLCIPTYYLHPHQCRRPQYQTCFIPHGVCIRNRVAVAYDGVMRPGKWVAAINGGSYGYALLGHRARRKLFGML